MTASRRMLTRVLDGVGVTGLAVLVVATFAPWVRTGRAARSSYAAAGLLRRLEGVDGAEGDLLRALPFLPLGAALAGIALATGSAGVRTAGRVVALVVAAAGLAAAALALRQPPSLFVRPDPRGPGVAVAGGAVVWLAYAIGLGYRILHRDAGDNRPPAPGGPR